MAYTDANARSCFSPPDMENTFRSSSFSISNSFIVVEIKVTELKKEHIGQIQTYMNYVDVNLKKEFHNKTTGVLLVRESNKWLIKYINNDDSVVREFITSN